MERTGALELTTNNPKLRPGDRNVIAASPFFDKDWYLDRNLDVAAAGIDPAMHYLLHGAGEGRDPGPRFSTSAYLAIHPDVEHHGMNPLLHYVLHGAAEGRLIAPSSVVQTIPSAAKREYEKKLISDYEEFLALGQCISIAPSKPVRISIVLVLHNKAHFSYACLKSIQQTQDARKDIEVVIVDSGSTDRTGELLSRVDGVIKTSLQDNAGFVRSVNKSAPTCSGEYLVLLNNDAILSPGSLDYALQTIQEDETIGAVGGRIILPSRVLQEAGCILWSDGTTEGYGRGQSPEAGPYMFRRDVAFCSGTFLMLRRNVFLNVGCFDERFAPAYYEETDLCVRLRLAGYRVVYDPRVEILHYEFGSAESPDAALHLQARHRKIFIEKHRHFLSTCPDRNTADLLHARTAANARKKILFLDDHVPYPELGVGYPRARNLLLSLAKAGYFLTMIPLEYSNDSWESVHRVLPLEVEVLLGIAPAGLASFISGRAEYYDLIFVSRPSNMKAVLAALEKQDAATGKIPIVYDAEAIWALREGLRRKLYGTPIPDEEYEKSIKEEVSLAHKASHIITVNEIEAEVFRARGCDSVSVVSHGFSISPTAKTFSERRDILFVGSLDDDPSPNADALIWFVQEILPLVRKGLSMPPQLIVAGRCGAHRVRALAGPDIILLGQVPDLTDVYNSARVFLAPHRYAGGIPTKILEAAAHGLPCVGSNLLAGQLRWHHGVEMLSATTPRDFAKTILELYSDELLWSSIQTNAFNAIERNYSEHRFETALEGALESAWSRRRDQPQDTHSWFRRMRSDLHERIHRWLSWDTKLHEGKLREKEEARCVAKSPVFATSAAEGRQSGSRSVQRTGCRVVCISGEPDSVAQVYRVDNLVAAMKRAGTASRSMTIKTALANPQIIADANLLVLWRAAFDDSVAALLQIARANGAAVLFDADDLVIEPQLARITVIDGIRTQNLSEQEVETYYRRTLQSFEAADWACCSTEELASAMRIRGKPTFLLPNGFTDEGHQRARLEVHNRRAGTSDDLIRIGYATGTRTHQRDFAQASKAIASILQQRPDCRLVLFRKRNGGEPLLDPSEFKCLEDLKEQIEWRDFVPQDDLPAEFARFDINIAPLEIGNPFCEAKSELKFVEAALVEVCTVASPTGPFRRAIRHDETGLLAAGSEQWESALMRLVNDSDLRRRLSRAAYLDVLGKYGAHQRVQKVAAILDHIFNASSGERTPLARL